MTIPPQGSKTNRNAVKKFFITFSQSGAVTRDDLFTNINKTYIIKQAIIAQEPHKDGKPHLHAAIEFEQPLKKTQLLTFFITKYPDDFKRIDVQTMRSFKESFNYLTTPDKDKIVDSEPLLFPLSLTNAPKFSKTHIIFHQQFSDETPEYIARCCMCDVCNQFLTLYYETERSEFREFLAQKNKDEENEMLRRFFEET